MTFSQQLASPFYYLARTFDRLVVFKGYAKEVKSNSDLSKAQQAELLSKMVLNHIEKTSHWQQDYSGEQAGIKAARVAVAEIFQSRS